MKTFFRGYFRFLLVQLIVSQSPLAAQFSDYYLGPVKYSFINYSKNELILPERGSEFNSWIEKVSKIEEGEPEQLRIVHIGGSHIQADMYTHQIRKRFQELSPDMGGSRGLIFPYRVAKTNNPSNYQVRYIGNWTNCKNTLITDECRLGLTGMALQTSDSLASITIKINRHQDYFSEFDSVRVFHEPSNCLLSLITQKDTLSGQYDSLQACSVFNLSSPASAFRLELSGASDSVKFTLFGFSLDNQAPGIVYNAVGVNGAKLSSYLRCELYGRHLRAINPDLVIISIGTNDGYTRRFNKELYQGEYIELIRKTRQSVPGAAILLTVPNDSYLYRRYVNSNTELMRKIIFRIAKEYNCGIWDFYTIMGGLNSSQAWYSLGLMHTDRIHFTKKGYELKGELLYSAFLKAMDGELLKKEDELTENYY